MPIVLALASAGCAVRPYGYYGAGMYVAAPRVEFGYQPLLYDGYVVYYTDQEVPVYWANGVEVYVPVAYREVYVTHYHANRSAYLEWHAQRGPYYRGQHYERRDDPRPRPQVGGEHRRPDVREARERPPPRIHQERSRPPPPPPRPERARPSPPPPRHERALPPPPQSRPERERPQPQARPEREHPQPQARPEREHPQPQARPDRQRQEPQQPAPDDRKKKKSKGKKKPR
jgi:hypothetical protein